MKKLFAFFGALAIVFAGTIPVHADIVNRQVSPLDKDDRWMPAGLDIQYVEVAEDSRDFEQIVFFVYMRGWVSRYSFSPYGGSDYVSISIDSNNDGSDNFFIATPMEVYPENRSSLNIEVLDLYTGQLASNCRASTWMDDGYSASKSNWIGFQVNRDCLNLGSRAAISAYSQYLGDYFDFTNYFEFDTGVSDVAVQDFDLPTARPFDGFLTENPGREPADLVSLSPSVLESVVRISCNSGSGSGWAANVSISEKHVAEGFRSAVVTNHHVVESCIRQGFVTVIDSTGSEYSGSIFAVDRENDLAGVFIDASLPKLEWQGQEPSQGWWTGVLGAPRQIQGYLTTGLLSAIFEDGSQIGTTAALNPGNSGGPIFDRNGRVIGTVFAKLSQSEGIGFATSAPMLCKKIFDCKTEQVWLNSEGLSSPDEDRAESENPKEPELPDGTESEFDGESDEKLNAGSFKGYVALYAKGYKGHRLSAKVGNDWVVIAKLDSDFVRETEFTGAGYNIDVRMYIDGALRNTINLTTK